MYKDKILRKMKEIGGQGGFIALIAVILLALSTLALSTVTSIPVASYADIVMRRELRVQAQSNVQSCLDHVILMLARDFFLRGEVGVNEFGCTAKVKEPSPGLLTLSVAAHMPYALGMVTEYGTTTVSLGATTLHVDK